MRQGTRYSNKQKAKQVKIPKQATGLAKEMNNASEPNK